MNEKLNLNPRQSEAANHQQGPLLIIAGAGAGKTKTIIARIHNLIKQGVAPQSILAVTFTNKAAKEMRDRLRISNLDQSYQDEPIPFVSTFHSLGVYILRQNANHLGLNKFFSILDRDESIRTLKTAMTQAGIDVKQFDPKKILGTISRQKGAGITAAEFDQTGPSDYWSKVVSATWIKYELLLNKAGSLDFDDLLLKTVILFKKHPDILKKYQDRWQYIHIDEYQDTNSIQYAISKMLADSHQNICVVGDVDQSIYSWRGADFTNIMNFEQDFPQATTVTLEENYRSTKNILSVANEIIKKNKKRPAKNLFTANHDGDKISLYSALNESDEADFIVSQIKDLLRRGIPAEQIAILYRANFQSRALEEGFLRQGLPYQVLGTRFFDRKEIKDVLCYLKAAINSDDFESFKRVINVPKRGIGKVTILKIAGGEEDKLPVATKNKIKSFRSLLTQIGGLITDQNQTASSVIKFVIEKSGIAQEFKDGSEDDRDRLSNVKELATLASKYDNLPAEQGILELLTEAALLSDQDSIEDKKPAVRLMTVHASKGLEFDVVFVTGLEEKLFPHEIMFAKDEDRDEEEERRLFYVAVTRARHKLFLTYAQTRTIYGSKQINLPSEFILDLPDNYLAVENPIGGEENFITY